MLQTDDQFAQAVVAAGLITAEELREVRSGIPAEQQPRNAEGLALLLQAAEKLTSFQANEILKQRNTPLLLDDYIILDRLGRGGMGEVFKAQHRRMERLVAIKLISAALTMDQAVKRFQREVKAAAKLSHPNIVATHDAGEHEGHHYLVMEFVDGSDLERLTDRQTYPPAQAVSLILQAAAGLEYAHAKGVIHRDIKPANLIVDQDGRLRILDMGIARIDQALADEGLTHTGQLMGTVDYMAPEQGYDIKGADARSDIYSLGCTLYRLLTGEVMYGGETFLAKARRHESDPIPSLLGKCPAAPAELETVFRRMVAKKPKDRYANMKEVREALTAVEKELAAVAAGSSRGWFNFAPWGKSGTDKPRTKPQALSPTLPKPEVAAVEHEVAGSTAESVVVGTLGSTPRSLPEAADTIDRPPATTRNTERDHQPAGTPLDAASSSRSNWKQTAAPSYTNSFAAIGICLLLAAVGFAVWMKLAEQKPVTEIAIPGEPKVSEPIDPPVPVEPPAVESPPVEIPQPSEPPKSPPPSEPKSIAKPDPGQQTTQPDSNNGAGRVSEGPLGNKLGPATSPQQNIPAPSQIVPAQPSQSNPAKPAKTFEGPAAIDYGIPQVAEINKQIRQGWADNDLSPSPSATDGEWCRRVYLDVIGRVPQEVELLAFLSNQDPDRKAKLVDKLLNDGLKLEIDEYANNWTTIWTNTLIGRTSGDEARSLINREGMKSYLHQRLASSTPYDRIVTELVTATGSTTPGNQKFNGATNFYINKLDNNATQATAKTANIFLGVQIQCTQCHNHPFMDWKQKKYWEFNAFFRQTRAMRTFNPQTQPGLKDQAELVNQDFGGEGGNASEAIIFFELRNGLLATAFPVFIDGQEAPKSGYVSDTVRRNELAKLIVGSDYMPKAIVNRMWQHFLGHGFTNPIDDMGPHNPPTHPELLDYLANEFRTNKFALKELIRWIALSEAYSLSSKLTARNRADDPQTGVSPKFSHFYLRSLRPEEVALSLIAATDAANDGFEGAKLKQQWLQQFYRLSGNDEEDKEHEETTFDGGIAQTMTMWNGELMRKATSTAKGSFLDRLTNREDRFQNKIESIFKFALARSPTNSEAEIANKIIAVRLSENLALQDVFWAVLNSNEFILQH